MLKLTLIVCKPVGAFAGIANVATTVLCVGCEIAVPTMVPARVTLVGKFAAGGCGGVVGSVIVTMTVVPRAALPPGPASKLAKLAPFAIEDAIVSAPEDVLVTVLDDERDGEQ